MDSLPAWLAFLGFMAFLAAVPAAIAFATVTLTRAEQEDAAALARAASVSASTGMGGEYVPNHIPLKTRIWHSVISVTLLIYGSIGLYLDDLYLPGKYGNGAHLHGNAALVMYGAMLCAALNLLSVVADHYDRRNNELDYRMFAKWTYIAGFVLFFAALAVSLVSLQPGPRS